MFTTSHGIIRHLGSEVHPIVLAFFSNLFSALFYVPWLARVGFGPMRTKKFHLHVARSFINVASLSTWYIALSLTPLGDASALALIGPLFVTLGAAVFLGEAMRVRRWVAIGVGIIGAVIIIRPGFEAVNIGFAFVLISGVFSAGTKIFAKHLSKWDSAITCSAYVAILQTPISFVLALFFWTTPSPIQLAWIAAVGVLAAIGHITMVMAIRYVDVSSLEPFVFTRLIWAALIGYFAFSEFPGVWTWIGAAIIVGATSYILRRESKLQRGQNRATEDESGN
ncbi:MAG: DMT family transporter [Rhodospirillales bacterium]|nr:DMT family transporter [Rhodospirillales bacterium]